MARQGNNVERCVESLCQHGCGRVTAYIELLRAGEVFAEVAALDVTERQQVLHELLTIMAPYEGRDND